MKTSWVRWGGPVSLANAENDRAELERLLTQPPFTKVEVECTGEHNLLSIYAEFPGGSRVLESQALRLLLERLLELTGADARFNPENVRQDPFFGDLRWETESGSWYFVARAGENGVEGYIRPELPTPQPAITRLVNRVKAVLGYQPEDRQRAVDISPLLEQARTIVETIDEFEQRVMSAAADRLLDLYNNNWSGGATLDRAGFLSRLRFSSVTIEHDGSVRAWLDAGELFSWHGIEVRLNSDGSIEDACLVG
jgi:hypothetical protein